MNARTAADWLASIGPVLDRIKAEDEAIAKLHSAHVDAWLDAEYCEKCGNQFGLHQLTRNGRNLECQSCYQPMSFREIAEEMRRPWP